METLMDLYNSVESSLDDIDIIKKCIELYSETQKSGRSFYKALVEINSNEKENSGMYRGFDEEVLDNWRMSTFKDNIVNMTPEKYASLLGSKDGYYSEEFQLLRDFFMQIDEIDLYKIGETNSIREKIEKNSKLNNAFQKYGFDIFQSGWDYISSSEVLETKPVETTHRLYINMDGVVKYKLIALIINEFSEAEIPFHFKYNDASRDDTIVMWTDNENLVKTIELLKKIREKNKELLEDGIFQPPILSGKIDNWIGYGSEPTMLLEGKRTSFNRIRAEIVENAIANVYTNYSSLDSKRTSVSEIVESDAGFIQAVRDEIIKIGKKCGIDENNFCFDTQTVEQMKQADNKSKQISQQPISDVPAEETSYKEAITLADELLQKPGIAWEDLLKKDDEKQSYSNEPSSMTEETQDLEAVLVELNKIKANDEKRKAQKQKETQRGWKSKFDKRDKDYYKKAEAYLLGELKRLNPEERKKENQYLSALEKNEQERQLENCYEVIREYQEKQKDNPNKNIFEKKQIIKKENTNPSSSSRPIRAGHQRPMSGTGKDDIHSSTNFEKKQQMKKEDNRVQRTVSSMLGDINNLTPEERSRASEMLDVLEQDKEHNRGHNRGRGR